jgi:hypothetical protein
MSSTVQSHLIKYYGLTCIHVPISIYEKYRNNGNRKVPGIMIMTYNTKMTAMYSCKALP